MRGSSDMVPPGFRPPPPPWPAGTKRWLRLAFLNRIDRRIPRRKVEDFAVDVAAEQDQGRHRRGGQQDSQDARQGRPDDGRHQDHDRMHAQGVPQDTGHEQVVLELLNDDEEGDHDQGEHQRVETPPVRTLEERHQRRDRPRHHWADDRHEFQQARYQAQYQGVAHAQDAQPDGHDDGDHQSEHDLTPQERRPDPVERRLQAGPVVLVAGYNRPLPHPGENRLVQREEVGGGHDEGEPGQRLDGAPRQRGHHPTGLAEERTNVHHRLLGQRWQIKLRQSAPQGPEDDHHIADGLQQTGQIEQDVLHGLHQRLDLLRQRQPRGGETNDHYQDQQQENQVSRHAPRQAHPTMNHPHDGDQQKGDDGGDDQQLDQRSESDDEGPGLDDAGQPDQKFPRSAPTRGERRPGGRAAGGRSRRLRWIRLGDRGGPRRRGRRASTRLGASRASFHPLPSAAAAAGAASPSYRWADRKSG